MVVVCKETSQSCIDLIHREIGFMLRYFKKSTLTSLCIHLKCAHTTLDTFK